MNFSNIAEPSMPWWGWFLICWGAVFVLWLCFGNKKHSRKWPTSSK